jgi:hypothetical protein
MDRSGEHGSVVCGSDDILKVAARSRIQITAEVAERQTR